MVKRKYSGPPGGSKKARTASYRKPLPRIPRAIGHGVLGPQRRVKLRYSDTFSLTGSVGFGNYVLQANSCFDPNNTGVGHQPRGFDEMMAFYDHFVVVGATLKIRFRNKSSATRPYPVISVRDSSNNIGVSVKDYIEYGDKALANKPLMRQSTNDDAGHAACNVLSISTDIGKFIGAKDILDREDLKGSAAGSPTEGVWFHVSCFDVDGGSVSVACVAEIVYDVVFVEPKNPGSS